MKQVLTLILAIAMMCSFCSKNGESLLADSTDRKTRYEHKLIVTDDVVMLTCPATGLENRACSGLDSLKTVILAAGETLPIDWSQGKKEASENVQILRLTVSRNGDSVTFTMVLYLDTDTLDGHSHHQLRCMKGDGCNGWGPLDSNWIQEGKNLIDHTLRKFQVLPDLPNSPNKIIIVNTDTTEPMAVDVHIPKK